MGRWLAIGAVVGFAIAVIAISTLGGPGDQPPAPPPPAAVVDGGAVAIPAIEAPMKLPTAAERRLGAMGPAMVVEQAAPNRQERSAGDAGPAQ